MLTVVALIVEVVIFIAVCLGSLSPLLLVPRVPRAPRIPRVPWVPRVIGVPVGVVLTVSPAILTAVAIAPAAVLTVTAAPASPVAPAALTAVIVVIVVIGQSGSRPFLLALLTFRPSGLGLGLSWLSFGLFEGHLVLIALIIIGTWLSLRLLLLLILVLLVVLGICGLLLGGHSRSGSLGRLCSSRRGLRSDNGSGRLRGSHRSFRRLFCRLRGLAVLRLTVIGRSEHELQLLVVILRARSYLHEDFL